MKNLTLFLLVVIGTLLLAACGADVDRTVTFYRNEEWKAELLLKVPTGTLSLVGSPAELEANFEEFIQEAEAMGVDASWRSKSDGDAILYTFDFEGQGLDKLKDTVFEDSTELRLVESDGDRQIVFSDRVSGDLLSAGNNTLTLIGGEVVASNGTQLDKGSVQWVNPSGRLEAVLTEKGGFNITGLLVVVFIGGVIGVGFYFWRSQRRRAGPCHNCGAWLEQEAQFCPYCGQKR